MTLEFQATYSRFLDAPIPDFLCHYTNPSALIKICESQTLLAGVPSNMNDHREQKIAGELCERYLQRLGTIAANLFVDYWNDNHRGKNNLSGAPIGAATVSFSAAIDSLEQWRAYGGGNGSTALAFSGAQVERMAQDADLILVKCIYDPSQHEELTSSLVQKFLPEIEKVLAGGMPQDKNMLSELSGRFQDSVMLLSSALKDPSFASEDEWRLVSRKLHYIEPDAIVLLAGKYGISPYLSVDLKPAFEEDPVARFWIGPNGNVNQMAYAAEALGGKLLKGFMESEGRGINYNYSSSSYRV